MEAIGASHEVIAIVVGSVAANVPAEGDFSNFTAASIIFADAVAMAVEQGAWGPVSYGFQLSKDRVQDGESRHGLEVHHVAVWAPWFWSFLLQSLFSLR